MAERKPSFMEEIEQDMHRLEQDGETFAVFRFSDWERVKTLIESRLVSQGREIIQVHKQNRKLSAILARVEKKQ
ncbi:hypothetical protein [Vibrio sp.]|uniref:hypothetical protein n=1 Tax=Vibrio sp. TaxID=678 RepID=UPI003D0A8834